MIGALILIAIVYVILAAFFATKDDAGEYRAAWNWPARLYRSLTGKTEA